MNDFLPRLTDQGECLQDDVQREVLDKFSMYFSTNTTMV